MKIDTFAANVVKDPAALGTTKSDRSALTVRVASTPRWKDNAGRWQDGDTEYYDVSVYGAAALNAAQLTKGAPVLVIGGTVKPVSYQAKDGSTKTSLEVRAQQIIPDFSRGQFTFTHQGVSTRPTREDQTADVAAPSNEQHDRFAGTAYFQGPPAAAIFDDIQKQGIDAVLRSLTGWDQGDASEQRALTDGHVYPKEAVEHMSGVVHHRGVYALVLDEAAGSAHLLRSIGPAASEPEPVRAPSPAVQDYDQKASQAAAAASWEMG